ncbi:MAG TPA: 4Fe-4S dicluster domain-containing protein [Dehalococcoidales bacterium]
MSTTKENVTFIPVYIMGKRYEIPKGLTIMQALEYAGYKLIRGVGCRGGFCGACATVYQIKGNSQLQFDLACQTEVQPDMYLTQIPFFPTQKAGYKINELKPEAEEILKYYPDLVKCFGCNTCTKACPQELEVMWYMSDALRGDLASVADKSFDCVMCGLCAARCPQGLQPYNVAILCRRLVGKYKRKSSQHLEDRLVEIKAGKFTGEIEQLKKASQEELNRKYASRIIESEQ